MSVTTVTLSIFPANVVVDVQASSHLPLQDVLPYLLTACSIPLHPEYGHVRYEYESSWDMVRWEQLSELQSLQEQRVFDGMHLRITKYVSYSSSLSEQPAWLHDVLPLFEQ